MTQDHKLERVLEAAREAVNYCSIDCYPELKDLEAALAAYDAPEPVLRVTFTPAMMKEAVDAMAEFARQAPIVIPPTPQSPRGKWMIEQQGDGYMRTEIVARFDTYEEAQEALKEMRVSNPFLRIVVES